MRTLRAGPDGVTQAGAVIDVSRKEGQSLLESGFAEAVEEAARRRHRAVESATAEGPEESAVSREARAGSEASPT